MGLDGFVLNIGYPQDTFAYPIILSLFGYTEYQNSFGRPFKLLTSMDLWTAGAHKHADVTNVNAFDYGDLFGQFLHRSGYYTVNGSPMITTFSDGGMSNVDFEGWRQTLGDN